MSKIELDDIKLNYEVEGKGYPIVFIHGLADKIEYWMPLTNDLKNDFKTICFDLRGHGKTDLGNQTPDIDLYAKDLFDLLNYLNIKKATFVGLSLGGSIAMNFAIKYPNLCSKLVIMNSFSELLPETIKIFDDLEKSLDLGYKEFCHEILPHSIPQEVYEENRNIIEDTIKNDAKTVNIQGLISAMNACRNVSITNQLNEINVPTLLISGKDDDFTSPAIQHIISENIKDCKQVFIKNTKHNLLIEQNIDTLIKLIRNFEQEHCSD